MILLIDNYDSFSHNLYQMLGAVTLEQDTEPDIKIIRNDEMTVAEIEQLKPERIVISPGPGRPENAGICIEVIQKLHSTVPILGICLGHQCIYQAFGGTVSYAKKLMHGKSSEIMAEAKSPLFKWLPTRFRVARYHSLAGLEESLPHELEVLARTEDGEIMAVSHKSFPVFGLQFHPESILTPQGKTIIENFLKS